MKKHGLTASEMARRTGKHINTIVNWQNAVILPAAARPVINDLFGFDPIDDEIEAATVALSDVIKYIEDNPDKIPAILAVIDSQKT